MRRVRFVAGLLLLGSIAGAFGWLAVADIPAPQSRVTIAIPAEHFSSPSGAAAP